MYFPCAIERFLKDERVILLSPAVITHLSYSGFPSLAEVAVSHQQQETR
jgi:hypothetical protein